MKLQDPNSGQAQDSRQCLTSVAPPLILVLEKKKDARRSTFWGGAELLTDKLTAIFPTHILQVLYHLCKGE